MIGINKKIKIDNNNFVEVINDSFNLYKEKDEIVFEDENYLLIVDGRFVGDNSVYEDFLKDFKNKGIEAIEQLNGSFSFVLFDKEEDELYLVADPFATKPIFYSKAEDFFAFSSKIQDLLRENLIERNFNQSLLGLTLSLQYTPGSETFFKGTYLIEPGQFLKYSFKSYTLESEIYTQYEFHPMNEHDEDLEEELYNLLKKSIEERKERGTIASFLSSGIDSSFITKILMPDKTFTAAFDHNEGIFDEASTAVELSDMLGIDCEVVDINGSMVYEYLPEIQRAFDTPFGNLSALPLFFLNRAAQDQVDQVFTGEGADEFFGGYDSYLVSKKQEILKKTPHFLKKTLISSSRIFSKSFSEKLINTWLPVEETFMGETKIFNHEELKRILNTPYKDYKDIREYVNPIYQRFKNATDLQKKMMVNMEIFMVYDILRKADRMNRPFDVSAEMPFYDRDIINFSKKLTDDQKINHNTSKVLLRRTAISHLPDKWVKKRKLGFPVPLRYWIKEEKFYNGIYNAFTSNTAKKFFDQDYIIGLLTDHKEDRALNHRKIYNIYAFLIWYDEYFIKYS